MLTPDLRAAIQNATENVVDTLGVPATWTQTKTPNASQSIVAGFKSVSWNDQELINAFGIGAKIFTIKVVDIAVVEKFDSITVNDDIGNPIEKYVLDAVMPVHLNGIHIFHKAIVKGR